MTTKKKKAQRLIGSALVGVSPEAAGAWLQRATIDELTAENDAIEMSLLGCVDLDERRKLGLLRSLVCSRKSEAYKQRNAERRAAAEAKRSAPPPVPPPPVIAQDSVSGKDAKKGREQIGYLYRSLYADAARRLHPSPSETPDQFAERVKKWADAMMRAAEHGVGEFRMTKENQ